MRNAIRSIELSGTEVACDESVFERIYRDELDAVVVRQAFPANALAPVSAKLVTEGVEAEWGRPNAPLPGSDLRLLGTGAAPTATTPAGPDEAVYFEDVARTRATILDLFAVGAFEPFEAIESTLSRLAAGGSVELAANSDGRRFSACTIRSLPDGEGLLLHHDNHYLLPVYTDLAPRLDTSTCISFFVVLQRPDAGGRLCVYALKPSEDGDLPRLPTGMLDPLAVDQQVPHSFFDLEAGDLIAFGASRLYHRVEPVEGPRSRVTMGGFLALDQNHERVLYWS